MEFVKQNLANFEIVNGGFEFSCSWGFLIGTLGTFIFLRYIMWAKKFPKKREG
jgi:hypothetical protein